MYLTKIRIKNLKCFEDVALEFPRDERGGCAGWFVLLGENGLGKSSLLQAMSLGIVGPRTGQELLSTEERARWVRHGAERVEIEPSLSFVELRIVGLFGGLDKAPRTKASGRRVEGAGFLQVNGSASGDAGGDDDLTIKGQPPAQFYGGGPWSVTPFLPLCGLGYGPRRVVRERGGAMRKLSSRTPRERSRHATLFDTSALLFDGEHLLCSLLNAENDPTQPETNRAVFRKRRARLTSLLNSLLESEGLSVAQVRPSEVLYADRQGAQVTLDSLSDGFRSFLSLILDMLAHLHLSGVGMAEGAADPLDALETLEGVVLIDEADVHLHPSWQRRLGDKLRAVFPRVQFIVTTHSPFIAQSATPNGLFRLRSDGGKVTVEQVQMDPEGQTADQLLLSELFDLPSTRDTDTEAKMLRRQALLSQVSRSPDEERELLALGDELNLRLRRSGEDLRDRELMDRAWALLRGGGR